MDVQANPALLHIAGRPMFEYQTDWRPPAAEYGLRANKEWVRAQLLRMTAIPTPAAVTVTPGVTAPANVTHGPSGVTVDQNTLKWKSWVGQAPDDGATDDAEIASDPCLYKLTQAEYKRLNEQVRDTLGSTHGRRGSGFKDDDVTSAKHDDMLMTYEGKLIPSIPWQQRVYVMQPAGSRVLAQCGTYAIPNPFPCQKFYTNDHGENTPVVHRSQLATSFRAFHDKRWRPYDSTREGAESANGSFHGSSRPSSSSSARSEQRILDKRPPSSAGRTVGCPVTKRPPRPRSVHGGNVSRSGPDPVDGVIHNISHQGSSSAGQGGNYPRHKSSTSPYYPAVEEDYGEYQRQYIKSRKTPDSRVPLRQRQGYDSQQEQSRGDVSSVTVFTDSNVNGHRFFNFYDNLTPEIAYQLSDGQQPLSVYGSRAGCEKDHENQTLENVLHNQESRSRQSQDGDGEADKDSNDSDDEDIPEPKLEDVKMANLPKLNLRPEHVDAMYIPDSRHDRRKYDFDLNNSEKIPYPFQDALSSHLMAVDLYHASTSDRSWRTFSRGPASSQTEEKIMERLLELERLQRKTKDQEVIRRERIKSANIRAKSRSGQTTKQGVKVADRKCCSDCLQVACVGDCPSKRANAATTLGSTNCLVCGEKECNGRCCESAYDARSRQARTVEEEPKKVSKSRPRSCGSCPSKNTAKFTNANNVIVGRPKSGVSNSPKDMRVGKETEPSELEEEFEKLRVDPRHQKTDGDVTRPVTASGRGKARGRSSQMPGKSFFSQRRNSLTDIAKEIRVKSANRKRLKSGKREKQTP